MISLATQQSAMNAKKNEREENVCRLLASGMPAEDVSLTLKIRIDSVRDIEKSNAKTTIPEYRKTYEARLKRREKQTIEHVSDMD